MKQILAFTILLAGFFSGQTAAASPSSDPLGEYEKRLRAAELADDPALKKEVCRAWYASGEWSSGVLNWNYNALMSVEENAVLLTRADLDTYPVWLLQNALDVRPDVVVLNLQMLENKEYRAKAATRIGMEALNAGGEVSDWLHLLLSGRTGRPIFVGVLPGTPIWPVDDQQLYLTGLALKFSPGAFDNLAALLSNYENHFLIDYLKMEFQPEKSPELVDQLNLNYMPAFVLLHQIYRAAGDNAKAEEVQTIALQVARRADREAEVRQLFEKDRSVVKSVLSAILPKTLEKPMKKVTERLYAAETETTNGQYEAFLQDLLKNKEFDLLDRCKTTRTEWHSLLPDAFKNEPNSVVFANGHPDDEGAPVQSISQEAAKAYCDWMTTVYNQSADKKKFKKVCFRLPTPDEWSLAANGGLKNVAYPWGGAEVRNNKGCYLCNLNASEPCAGCAVKDSANDGGFFPVHANSYFPNNLGLYCMAGNVAEMTQTPGVAKGGNWQDPPDRCRISSEKSFNTPDPTIGFRVFMEVIEE